MSEQANGKHLIARPRLMGAITKHQGTPDVKVLVGVRRCGKSSLMSMFVERLRDQGVPECNIFFKRLDTFDIPLGYSLTDLDADVRAALGKTRHDQPAYILLDEIQTIEGWEHVVRRLHAHPACDVYITGSNAQLLSSDLSTNLTGRYVEIPVYPLSFAEYCTFPSVREQQRTDIRKTFETYMRFGGMPGLFALNELDEDTAATELQTIYQSIVLKDVAQRYGVRDIATLEKLSRYLFSTSGNLLSVNRIVNTLKSNGVATSTTAIENQLNALEKAFMVHRAEQVGMQGRQILRPQSKFYPVDNGFRNLATGFSGRDLGAQLEGIVFMELQRRGWTVGIGTGAGSEIDFIATKFGRKYYIQVTLSMLDPATRERELRPLRSITDAFPRLVVTLDPLDIGITEEGIEIVTATDWLLDQGW